MNVPPASPPETHLAPGKSQSERHRIHSRTRKIDVPLGGKMEGSVVREKIAKHGMLNSNGELDDIPEALRHKTVFGIENETIIDAAAQPTSFLLTDHCSLGTSSMSNHHLRTLQASNIEKSTIDVKKEQRGVMATATAAREYSDAEKNACSIEAMMNGGTCEACR